MSPMTSRVLDASNIRDLRPLVLDEKDRMKILPAAFWAETTPDERAMFGHYSGVYSFPTTELVEHLAERIAGRKAIEIGAGHCVLADALGIPGTDSKMQSRAKMKKFYAATTQPPVVYGRNIIPRPAHEAVRRYEPDVVIGCWVTHRYDPARHFAGGNVIGIDEGDVISHCGEYIVVGNEQVHADKAIWVLPHTKITPPWLYSRATNGSPNFIATWKGGRP